MPINARSLTCFVLAWCASSLSGAASLTVSEMYSDGAVLQRDKPVRVWGGASPGARIDVAFAGGQASTRASSTGEWLVELASLPASSEPRELLVKSSSGEARKFSDILVGDVWVVGGQSNMELRLVHTVDGQYALDNAENPKLRLFMARQACSATPRSDADPAWRYEGKPQAWLSSVRWSANRFGAVGWYMGAELQRSLGVPIGVVQVAVGGTRIEAWTPRAAFQGNDDFRRDREWLERAERALQRAPESDHPTGVPANPGEWYGAPTCFYNGMVSGLVNYQIRGLAWYQGEANVAEAELYDRRLDAFVVAMRKVWRDPALPIALVQVAPFAYPDPDGLPLIWQAQLRTSAARGLALIPVIDLVEDVNDLHPRNKYEIGRRLQRWAVSLDSGQGDLNWGGPVYRKHVAEGSSIRVYFNRAPGLFTRFGGPVTGFQLSGDGTTFVDAEARIDGETVIVMAAAVDSPRAVRYAWKPTARPTLMNGAGLPAIPFSAN